jgi:hypothetical protein
VFFVLVVGGFIRQIDTRSRVGAILAFLRHGIGVPDFPLHRDKAGTARAFRRDANFAEIRMNYSRETAFSLSGTRKRGSINGFDHSIFA